MMLQINVKQKKNEDASWILRIEYANCLMNGNLKECKALLRRAKDYIEKKDFVDNQVNSSYYEVEAEFLKETKMFSEHYKSSLLYLAYTPIDTFDEEKKRKLL